MSYAHLGVEGAIALVIVAFFRLTAFAIDTKERWRRYLVVVFLMLAVAAAAAWWLVGDGGLAMLLRDFGPASITPPGSAGR